jgi:hypothetical protein
MSTALRSKPDEKEEAMNMEKERIEAETRQLEEEQRTAMLARLEEEKRERGTTAKETAESELKRKMEEKRKSKADISKPWIKRKPKREDIDPTILASLISLESRSASPLPLSEHKASMLNNQEDSERTSQSPSSTPAPVDTNPQTSNEAFVLVPVPVLEARSSPITIVLDERNVVVSARPTRKQDDVVTLGE